MADPLCPKQLPVSKLSHKTTCKYKAEDQLTVAVKIDTVQCWETPPLFLFVLLLDKNGAVVTLSR